MPEKETFQTWGIFSGIDKTLPNGNAGWKKNHNFYYTASYNYTAIGNITKAHSNEVYHLNITAPTLTTWIFKKLIDKT